MKAPIKVMPCLRLRAGRALDSASGAPLLEDCDPIKAVAAYEKAGADMLCLHLDKEQETDCHDMLQQIVDSASIPVIAGNVNALQDAKALLSTGISRVILGTAALLEPSLLETVSAEYGRERVIVEITAKKREDGGYDASYAGGTVDSRQDALAWAKRAEALGAGMLMLSFADPSAYAPDMDYVREIADSVSIPLIFRAEFADSALAVEAVALGHAKMLAMETTLSEDRPTLGEIKSALEEKGIAAHRFSVTGDLDAVRFDEKGLVPAIVQDSMSGEVLMQAYMNRDSLRATLDTGLATYFSRSRGALWVKGETSGHLQFVRELHYDCDGDSLLLKVRQLGPACHMGKRSCFHNALAEPLPGAQSVHTILQALYGVIADRDKNPKEGSYTNYLLTKGVEKICKKVGEEASEVIIAAMKGSRDELRYEASDLLYHLLVLLYNNGVDPEDVLRELLGRR